MGLSLMSASTCPAEVSLSRTLNPPASSSSSPLTSDLPAEEGVKLKENSLRGPVKCHIILLPSPSLHYSLPLVCPHRSRRRSWGHRGSCWGSRWRTHHYRCLPEDQGARCGAATASGGPLEGRQVRGGHRAGAEDAQIHGAQHHRQVPAQQHSGEPAPQWATKETLRSEGETHQKGRRKYTWIKHPRM